MKTDPLEFLYDGLEHGVETVYKEFAKEGDGQNVTVYVTALPAKFYRVYVHPGVDWQDNPTEAFSLSTGSGPAMEKLACEIAKAISEGCLYYANCH